MIRALRTFASFLALALQVARLGSQPLPSADEFVATTQAFVERAELWTLEPEQPAPTRQPSKR